MSILVFGKTGQVARELQTRADVTVLDRQAADLSDPAACARAIMQPGQPWTAPKTTRQPQP